MSGLKKKIKNWSKTVDLAEKGNSKDSVGMSHRKIKLATSY